MSSLIIAAAGAGKTTFLVKRALEISENILITTYTDTNEQSIREKFYEINGCIPANVTIMPWFSLLIRHGIRPYQSYLIANRVSGVLLVNKVDRNLMKLKDTKEIKYTMGIVVIGDVFIDIKGFSTSPYIPYGRNAGTITQIHGGVGRNVAEDIANVELEPTFVSSVDDDAMGEDVIRKLDRHKVNTKYMKKVKNGMGTWLAVFDHEGDVVASISKRPDHKPIEQILDEHGNEIFKDADSIVIEIDIDREIVKKTFHYAEKYKKKVYAIVSNMTIAIERRDFIRRTECFVCNQQEAGILFSEDYEEMSAEELSKVLSERIQSAKIPKMVVTMGGEGAVYADQNGEIGVYPALKVDVVDTTGAGDAFFSGVCIGLTYGKTLREACEIGTRLASTVICTSENICPRFMPEEFGITR